MSVGVVEATAEEVARWSALPEGQFFERKSAIDRSGERPKRRSVKDLARDVAETLCAMANADGGELVVGMEDDGTVTGVPHPADHVRSLLRAAGARDYVDPPIPVRARPVPTTDGLLLHFVVEWSPLVHRLADGRYLLRVHDRNMPFSAEQMAALKSTKGQGLVERSFPPGATVDDLDLELVMSIIPQVQGEAPMGLTFPVEFPIEFRSAPSRTPADAQEFLRRHRLIADRVDRAVPCLAGLLLFGKDPLRWHPRCDIDFVRWEGTERKHGAALNVSKRVRIERPLAILIRETFAAIQPFIRERQSLIGLFFAERLEYPPFVWQEAIVNAVAHRDYSIQGASIEVWMFDDRIEVRSPGLPPQPVTVEALNQRQHLHLSRNPLIVRTLAELGYMRELGEGIPRMFDVMEQEGFYPPRFASIGDLSFEVTLRNQPIYDRATLEWLQQFRGLNLSGAQRRLLVYARAHGGSFTAREYRKLVQLDPYSASLSIKDLIRKGVAQSTGKGSRVYNIREPQSSLERPEELDRALAGLGWGEPLTNRQVRAALGVGRLAAARYLHGWVEAGWLRLRGRGRASRYEPATPPSAPTPQ